MILVLGASGYVGQAFVRALIERKWPYRALSRREANYTHHATLAKLLRDLKPEFLINAAGYTGVPNVDVCERNRTETVSGNVLLPKNISRACQELDIPWGQVSSGCIYNGAWIRRNDCWGVESDLTDPGAQQVIHSAPNAVRGFAESDEPNFSYCKPPCSHYSACKSLCEVVLAEDPRVFQWRLRIPFNEVDHPRNFLTKLQSYSRIYDNINSLSQLDDYARACLDLWKLRAPFGTYNVTNPGFIASSRVVTLIRRYLAPHRRFEFWSGAATFYREAAVAPRSNCVLDTGKLLNAGVRLRSVEEAITDSLTNWKARN